jgi:hypothetical protein
MYVTISLPVCAMTADHFDQLLTDDVENEITLTAFRLLTMDLLALYSVMNEATINVLGNSRPCLWAHNLQMLIMY